MAAHRPNGTGPSGSGGWIRGGISCARRCSDPGPPRPRPPCWSGWTGSGIRCSCPPPRRASGAACFKAAWQELGFPRGLGEADREPWNRLLGLLPELETALGSEGLKAGEFLEWLKIGAQRVILPGPGIQAAGIQVLGLLEMRGLDFSHVFCLGMNSGTLPAPPRPLPLLSAAEKRLVLGGTYPSQHHFAAELFHNLLGAAPNLTLTRPRSVDQEEQVSTPLYLGEWSQAEMAVLTTPNPAWLRSPAIQAVFHAPAAPAASRGTPTLPSPFPCPGKSP